MDKRRKAYLEAMGIDLWTERVSAGGAVPVSENPLSSEPVGQPGGAPPAPEHAVPPAFEAIPAEAYEEPPPLDAEEAEDDLPLSTFSSLDWPELAHRVANCRHCDLCDSRSNTVFGVGDRKASLMVIGEAPGADEDRQGEPFVGRAGKLLTAMLQAIGFAREQVYIANILKCRPPGNRDPHVEEVAACQPYLNRQIELIQPTLILAVGGVSAKNLLHTDDPVGRLRGKLHQHAATGTPLMVTYHPAYLLRRPEEKAKAWLDLQKVWQCLHGETAQ